jgi:hypothetical protein
MVFVIQTLFALLFCWEDTALKEVQPFSITTSFFRVVAIVLMTLQYSKELYNSTKLLTLVKRMQAKKHRARFINIILASMQMLVPMATQFSQMIHIIQVENTGMITKSFVCLSLVIKIDDMFSASLPKDILDNSIRLNG